MEEKTDCNGVACVLDLMFHRAIRNGCSLGSFVSRQSLRDMTFPRHRVADEIRLTDAERNLFALLVNVVREAGLSETVVRVAGGWVRDKLLGRESHDIDVALNNVTGSAFAGHVNGYMKKQGLRTHKIGVIQANPDQSKHLETAKVKVLEHEVDFVNLRTEDYNEQSRIPGMRFGTALEDATRRDFTINALFYNVNEGKVEDLTEFGLKDLKQGVIRTPLPAAQTFKDDPLRIMRAFRFASRYGFRLDTDIEDGIFDPTVVEMLAQKVSRERIGVELVGILEGQQPLVGLELIERFKLMNIVFRIPEYLPKTEAIRQQQQQRLCLFEDEWGQKGMRVVKELGPTLELLTQSCDNPVKVDPIVVYLAGLLCEVKPKQVVNSKGRLECTSFAIIRDTLKLKHSIANQVAVVCRGSCKFVQLLSEEALQPENDRLRLEVGRLIRQTGALWPVALSLAGVRRQSDAVLDQKDTLALMQLIEGWSLASLHTVKPMLDGKYIMRKLGIGGGPALGKLMESLWDWRIMHPNGTKEECENYLHQLHRRDELNPGMRKRLKS